MKKTNLLVLANSMLSATTVSGGDRRFIEIIKRLDKKMNIFIMLPEMGFHKCNSEKLNVKYTILPFSFSDKLHFLLSYIFRIIGFFFTDYKKIILKNKSVVLYTPSDMLTDTIPATFIKIFYSSHHVKWVQIIHHIIPHPNKRKGNPIVNAISYLSQRLSFFLIKEFSNKTIVVNPLNKEKLITFGFDNDKIEFNPNGIDLDLINNTRPADRSYDAIYMGRVEPFKGCFDLIEISSNIIKKYPKFKLGIIGVCHKKIKNEMIKKIKEFNLENNVDILGFLELEHAYSLMKSSKLFLIPSYEEGFGIVILEAMACGLPVVTWNLPLYEHLFSNALIEIKSSDINSFSKKTEELLKNIDKRKIISNTGLGIASKYSWNNVASKEFNIITRAC